MRRLIISGLLFLLVILIVGYILLISFGKNGYKNTALRIGGGTDANSINRIFSWLRMNPNAGQDKALTQIIPKNKRPERVGETIIYNVYLGKLNLGRAVFKHLPQAQYKGKEARLITFETRLVRFMDLEKIYSDMDSFLPLRVERQITMWPLREQITEEYDQGNFTLTIKKIRSRKEEKKVIKKNSVINNAILLPYCVRDKDKLGIGNTFTVGLPTQDFVLELVAEEEVEVPAGKFKAYRFTSKPEKFEIWISSDERRIPLKIKGINGAGYILAMREYSAL